jgi:hypothetical protein
MADGASLHQHRGCASFSTAGFVWKEAIRGVSRSQRLTAALIGGSCCFVGCEL